MHDAPATPGIIRNMPPQRHQTWTGTLPARDIKNCGAQLSGGKRGTCWARPSRVDQASCPNFFSAIKRASRRHLSSSFGKEPAAPRAHSSSRHLVHCPLLQLDERQPLGAAPTSVTARCGANPPTSHLALSRRRLRPADSGDTHANDTALTAPQPAMAASLFLTPAQAGLVKLVPAYLLGTCVSSRRRLLTDFRFGPPSVPLARTRYPSSFDAPSAASLLSMPLSCPAATRPYARAVWNPRACGGLNGPLSEHCIVC